MRQHLCRNGVVMSKNWMMLTGLLFLGSLGTSQAHPLDSPDIVYIDGLPCNSACQSYMAWSRQQTSSMAQQSAPVKLAPGKPARRSSYNAVHHASAVHRESSKPAVYVRLAKQAVPLPPAKIAGVQSAGDGAVASEPARANVAASPAAVAGATATSNARTVQQQVAAATALAEHVTAASAGPVPQQQANNAEVSGRSEAAQTEPTASAPTNNTDNRVALLMARPEIKSLSDLTGKDVAIEDQQSASGASIRTAIAAAGAAEVQLNEGHTKAIDRLIGGEVPAAVLALVSPEAAEWFPDIPGYKIFRIPLSPRSSKARL
jgi:hypothetical protein